MTNSNIAVSKSKLDSLNFLRGVAVLMVCCGHFAQSLTKSNFHPRFFEIVHKYGANGVELFFVISGFIIPYSLMKGKYELSDYFTFLYKRLLRLHPPYLASLLFTLLVMFVSYKVRHVIFPENWLSIFRSLFYIHAPIDNPPYWTLKVEAQYYFFIGIYYILLIKRPNIAFFIVIPVVLFLATTKLYAQINLLKYIIYFLVGIASFNIYTNEFNKVRNWIMLAVLCIYGFIMGPAPEMIAAVAAALFILFFRNTISKTLQFPGTISYSIYLIHFPIGVKLMNLLTPKLSGFYLGFLFVGTLVLVVLLAWVFFKMFEEFSERLSKRVLYKAALAAKM